MKGISIIVLILGLIVFGCSSKKATLVSEDTNKQYNSSQMQPKSEETKKAGEGSQKTEPKQSVIKPEIESRELSLRSKRISEILRDIYFDFDKYDVTDDAKPTLKALADYLIKSKPGSILIEGHCDERGTSEYNLALGEKRALSTKKYLVSFGVSSSWLETISYGEEKPLCAGKTEDCWQKNRRVHFVNTAQKINNRG